MMEDGKDNKRRLKVLPRNVWRKELWNRLGGGECAIYEVLVLSGDEAFTLWLGRGHVTMN